MGDPEMGLQIGPRGIRDHGGIVFDGAGACQQVPADVLHAPDAAQGRGDGLRPAFGPLEADAIEGANLYSPK